MKRAPAGVAALVIAAALLLTGCGRNAGAADAPDQTPTPTASTTAAPAASPPAVASAANLDEVVALVDGAGGAVDDAEHEGSQGDSATSSPDNP